MGRTTKLKKIYIKYGNTNNNNNNNNNNKTSRVLERMQKAVLSVTLNIARTFKIVT